MSPPLDGRTALVTGAASGIGLAITQRLVSDGAHVLVGDIDDGALAAVADRFGDSVTTAHCDVTDEASIEAFAALSSASGGLDIAVANAGKGTFGMVVDHPLEAWREIIDLCLTGVFLTVKHAARVMRDGGSIVNIASLNAIQPSAGMAAYCAAKAGVVMFTQVAAMELGSRGIRVNAVGPGLVETTATSPFFVLPGVVEEFVENTTVGRFAQPADVANLVAFLVGDESTFVSGSFHLVDGGASTKRYPNLPAAFERFGGLVAE